jgi:hypothetical protein
MNPSRSTPRLPVALAALALAAVMLVVPASAPLCASDLGVCPMPVAPAPEKAPAHPPAEPHCPMAAAHGGGHGAAPDFPAMDCCGTDAAPHGPVPAVPAPAKKADAERQLQPLPALAPVAVALGSPAHLAPASAVSPPAADLAASSVPLYTLLSSLLS